MKAYMSIIAGRELKAAKPISATTRKLPASDQWYADNLDIPPLIPAAAWLHGPGAHGRRRPRLSRSVAIAINGIGAAMLALVIVGGFAVCLSLYAHARVLDPDSMTICALIFSWSMAAIWAHTQE
jgi:hypothetical protein